MPLAYTLTTANQPGAVAVLQVSGPADRLLETLSALTGRGGWNVGRLRLCDLAGIDQGLAGRLSETTAQLMPHGGPRVVQKLEAWLQELGAEPAAEVDTAAIYPEASTPIEADALYAVATAASPAAIDLLAQQPRLWRERHASSHQSSIIDHPFLDHLLTPPTVVVAGPPNAGKSTLLNRLTGRAASVVADLPGTTRDWVGGLVELVPREGDPARDAVAVRWLDTPGLRESGDPVEQAAIRLARGVLGRADVLIELTRAGAPGLPPSALPRHPDLLAVNHSDAEPQATRADAIAINARSGVGVDRLGAAVLERLGLDRDRSQALWAFSPTLRRVACGEAVDLAGYLGV